MSKEAAAFIRAQTVLAKPSAVPELTLHLATEVTPLWQMTEERLSQNGLPPPYWAFAWPGGQGIARYILDHPAEFQGKCILDFAAGCGIGAIAAMKAGAKSAVIAEIDPMAITATQLNAMQNNVTVSSAAHVDMTKPYKGVDIIIAGDVCYQQAMSALMLRWLWLCVAKGRRVILADPGRAYVPHQGLKQLGSYIVPTSRDLEDSDSRTVTVWDMILSEIEA